MKIIPNGQKDYYDHIAHRFGGGDPRVTYNRKRIGPWNNERQCVDDVVLEADFPNLGTPYGYIKPFSDLAYDIDYLVVCGKAYPLLELDPFNPSRQWELMNLKKHADILRWSKRAQASDDDKMPPYPSWAGVEMPELVTLCKLVGHPVFVVKRGMAGRRLIDGNCPNLSNIGLASVYPAEQLYQDLEIFLSSKMRESPDLAPPSPMSNKEKIVQHGFDVKQSFRHRKAV